ncbi:hypothetical protein A2382_00580 [Candidatus Woesebacteria bacterium RIFOXYB1_FULL_38_16]|uniref:Glycosyltransferase RgtA/B/C/D-like domain-containing protein n=1 Tax=Candidatus Woesebacteria bacterium RIFOXYB1_FULL_38_16 TaxID=1802538 RepID=A0A1F8CT62_9BACT|nr:MAG: hypothetical protein A2191_01460 [Candidatus Woesebacteria bacterium RIFOXYA1_FULL_38_9]OGM79266.1 MAG: hypothetical protein A2382_00580 [Candidatus Woesebacteria bacterium RIFOXYB1_FULL_38_16]
MKYMSRFLKRDKTDLLIVVGMVFVWRVCLSVFLFVALRLLPLQQNFLGGGMSNYLSNPSIWAWVNFDGEHYLAIAREGYKPLTYFFFPLYPVIIGFLARLLDLNFLGYAILGLLVSHMTFLLAVVGFWKLIRLSNSRNKSFLAVLLLLFFPTSFYFAAYYTEALFLAIVVWSFYFARVQKWWLASLLATLGTATRLVGIVLLPSLIILYFLDMKNILRTWKWFILLLIPAGLLIYMFFLYRSTGDPFEFLNSVGIFGEQRSSSFILLPQVFYRYFFKVLPNLNNYWPVVFTTLLELFVAILYFVLCFYGWRKLKKGELMFLVGGYLIPTLSGSFSSLPRYVLVLFPGYLLMADLIYKLPRLVRVIVFIILFFCLGIATSLYVRGYWLS